MSVCTFFGHRDCSGLKEQTLYSAIEELILKGADTFYVGNQGLFDSAVYGCLKRLQRAYPHIRLCIVLAYLPTGGYGELEDTMYPEIEGHPKFAIARRNRWMMEHADFCLCYITHTWGGAYTAAKQAKKKGLTVINLGSIEL